MMIKGKLGVLFAHGVDRVVQHFVHGIWIMQRRPFVLRKVPWLRKRKRFLVILN